MINLLYLLYSMAWMCCLLHPKKQNCLLKTLLITLILMTWLCLYLFSLLVLTWNCISITSKLVKKVRTNLYSSKASGPDYIRVVILKNCESQLSYILAEFFSVCLKWSYFPDCWKISLVVPVFRMLGKNLHLKTTALLIFFLWLVKSLKNLLIIGFLIT